MAWRGKGGTRAKTKLESESGQRPNGIAAIVPKVTGDSDDADIEGGRRESHQLQGFRLSTLKIQVPAQREIGYKSRVLVT